MASLHNVHISDELLAELEARAEAEGKTVDEIAEAALRASLSGAGKEIAESLSGSDRARAFRAWAKSFPSGLPVLSLEEISREDLYRRD